MHGEWMNAHNKRQNMENMTKLSEPRHWTETELDRSVRIWTPRSTHTTQTKEPNRNQTHTMTRINQSEVTQMLILQASICFLFYCPSKLVRLQEFTHNTLEIAKKAKKATHPEQARFRVSQAWWSVAPDQGTVMSLGHRNAPLAPQLHFISGSDRHLFLSRSSHVHTASRHCHRDLNNLYYSKQVSMFLDWDDTIGSSCSVSHWLQGMCVKEVIIASVSSQYLLISWKPVNGWRHRWYLPEALSLEPVFLQGNSRTHVCHTCCEILCKHKAQRMSQLYQYTYTYKPNSCLLTEMQSNYAVE